MSEINLRFIKTNGITFHVAESGEGPLVLLLHGWPELWYSWRRQLHALAEAGYHAVAPDIRGYGQTDVPIALDAYSMRNLLADIEGLLDALGERDAVLVGHDWGATMAWTMAALRPDRCRAVVGMSVPYLGRPPVPPTQLFEHMFGERWFYVSYFQEPGVAETELEADVARTMRIILAGTVAFDTTAAAVLAKRKGDGFLTGMEVPNTLPAWLSDEDLAYFVEQYEASSFRGGLNRYRNMDRDWEELPELATARIEQPALFITGEKDPARSLAPTDAMRVFVPNLQEVVVPGAGHWIQQEQAGVVNAALLGFLREPPDRTPRG
jgi:pimeloyl-ACP methyl ester carboxylesterase